MFFQDTEDDSELWFRHVTGLNIKSEYIPVFVGAVTSTVLLLLVVVAYVVWRCCVSVEKAKTHGNLIVHVDGIESRFSYLECNLFESSVIW